MNQSPSKWLTYHIDLVWNHQTSQFARLLKNSEFKTFDQVALLNLIFQSVINDFLANFFQSHSSWVIDFKIDLCKIWIHFDQWLVNPNARHINWKMMVKNSVVPLPIKSVWRRITTWSRAQHNASSYLDFVHMDVIHAAWCVSAPTQFWNDCILQQRRIYRLLPAADLMSLRTVFSGNFWGHLSTWMLVTFHPNCELKKDKKAIPKSCRSQMCTDQKNALATVHACP